MKALKIFIISIIAVCMFSTSYGQPGTEEFKPDAAAYAILTRIKEIFYQTIAADGQMNKEIHKEFWSHMPLTAKNPNDPRLEFLRNFIRNSMPHYQRELWSCASRSYKTRKVVKTERLQLLQSSAVQQALTTYKTGTPQYERLVKTLDKGVRQANALLVAAASHSVWHTVEAGDIEINPDAIKLSQDSLDAVLARVEILLDPKYYD